eukprot:1152342-Pelagomonas_calceolata.AAC.2
MGSSKASMRTLHRKQHIHVLTLRYHLSNLRAEHRARSYQDERDNSVYAAAHPAQEAAYHRIVYATLDAITEHAHAETSVRSFV